MVRARMYAGTCKSIVDTHTRCHAGVDTHPQMVMSAKGGTPKHP